jgi:GcrA cell cycle regulator
MSWNDDKVERLKALARQTQPALSASDIAKMMGGISRNAVIGKLSRIGVPLIMRAADGARRRSYERRAAAPKPVKRARIGSLTGVQYHHGTTAIPASLPAPSVEDVPRVAFADLEPWHCRYPVGDPQAQDFGFCGLNKAVGTSYCPGHLHRCTGQSEPRNRQSVPTVQPAKELAEA